MKPLISKSASLLDQDEAISLAHRLAGLRGEAFCVISRFSPKRGAVVFRVLPLKGFGLPRGWTVEDTVESLMEKVAKEPPEKTSTNGF